MWSCGTGRGEDGERLEELLNEIAPGTEIVMYGSAVVDPDIAFGWGTLWPKKKKKDRVRSDQTNEADDEE